VARPPNLVALSTHCHEILRLKCTKFDDRCGSAPDPTVRAYSALTDPRAGFKKAYFKWKGGEAGREWEGR